MISMIMNLLAKTGLRSFTQWVAKHLDLICVAIFFFLLHQASEQKHAIEVKLHESQAEVAYQSALARDRQTQLEFMGKIEQNRHEESKRVQEDIIDEHKKTLQHMDEIEKALLNSECATNSVPDILFDRLRNN